MPSLTKRLIIFGVAFLLANGSKAQAPLQVISLEQLQDSARLHYPLVRKYSIQRHQTQLQQELLSAAFRPQFSAGAQATYQSDVTQLPIKLPNISIEPPARDQYKAFAEWQQLIFDGGLNKQQRNILGAQEAVEQQRVTVDLYALRDRVLQAYMSILLADGRMAQIQLAEKDVQRAIQVVEAQVQQGTALRSGLAQLQAQQVQWKQQRMEWESIRATALEQLSLLSGLSLHEKTRFLVPEINSPVVVGQRPEWKLFQLQDSALGQQEKSLKLRNIPRVAAFLQTGYGRPALNMLKNSFEPYYLGGLRISWNLNLPYTLRRERSQLIQQRQSVDVQREVFRLNQRLRSTQLQQEQLKAKRLLDTDKELLDLRKTISAAAFAQLQAQVITPADYLRERTNEESAEVQQFLHQLQSIQIHFQQVYHEGN